MTAVIRCEDCGRMVPFDEDTDGPVPHACIEIEPEHQGLDELDFDSGHFTDD